MANTIESGIHLAQSSQFALWVLPFVVPLCLWTAYSDLSKMKIYNNNVLALAAVYVVLGIFLLPLNLYLSGFLALGVVLIGGMALNFLGLMGGGDAKFLAAAAPFVARDDIVIALFLFTAILLASVITHRLARVSPLRRLAPEWESWAQKRKFPMGYPLGFWLIIYLGLSALHGT